MKDHPLLLLVQKVESLFPTELNTYLNNTKKLRIYKFYKLIIDAKNEEQLAKELLFRKLFNKIYSTKYDYLWRNEVRLLKEELENFLIKKEHENLSKNNPAYNHWLLVQIYDKIGYHYGISEETEHLTKLKHHFASYSFSLEAKLIEMLNFQHSIPNLSERQNAFPEYIEESINTFKDLIAVYASRINLSIAQYNLLCYHHKYESKIYPITDYFTEEMHNNFLSNFYNNYSNSYITNTETRINSIENAISAIEPIIQNNKSHFENYIVIQMALARELSSNGYFMRAHDIFSHIKPTVIKDFKQHSTVFYVNYVTNLVKCKFYEEALNVMSNEFSTENVLYKNMLLQNKLLCYLYLRDIQQLEKHISFDLDSAPFPQNYMLKVIKSAYFYLIEDYDTALNIINSLLNAKYASEKMLYYKPISNIYKKLFVFSQKNILKSKWNKKEFENLSLFIEDFENKSTEEFKRISVYLWIKEEINKIKSIKSH